MWQAAAGFPAVGRSLGIGEQVAGNRVGDGDRSKIQYRQVIVTVVTSPSTLLPAPFLTGASS